MRDAKTILRELADKADTRAMYDTVMFGGRSYLLPEQKASLVGKLVQDLPEEDRKVLEKLTSSEIANMLSVSWKRPRPEKPITRRRGPVSLKK